MSLIDFILNIAGLLMWLSWRMSKLNPMAGATPATLAGTLRRADTPKIRGWHLPVALVALIFFRAVFYWQIGSAVNWHASMDVAVISIPFRSDRFLLTLLFSIFSFLLTLVVFLLCVLFLSLVSRRSAEFDGVRRFARLHLGSVEGWPVWLKLLLPLFAVTLCWWLLSWLLVQWGLFPQPVSAKHRLEQSVVIGTGSYLAWKHVILGVLMLHLVGSYVYLGNHHFWRQVNVVARQVLKPLNRVPLSVGRVDFAPVVAIALVFVLARMAEAWLTKLYSLLPL